MKKINKKFQNHFHMKSVCIVSDCFVPTQNSASGMLYNLSKSLLNDGANVTCIHSGADPKKNQCLKIITLME